MMALYIQYTILFALINPPQPRPMGYVCCTQWKRDFQKVKFVLLIEGLATCLAAFGSPIFRTNYLQLSSSSIFLAIQILYHRFISWFGLYKFGLYDNLRASMQWNIKQEDLRTTSPAAGMVVATQSAVGATLVLRPPGTEPWKASRRHKEPMGQRKRRFHSSAWARTVWNYFWWFRNPAFTSWGW